METNQELLESALYWWKNHSIDMVKRKERNIYLAKRYYSSSVYTDLTNDEILHIFKSEHPQENEIVAVVEFEGGKYTPCNEIVKIEVGDCFLHKGKWPHRCAYKIGLKDDECICDEKDNMYFPFDCEKLIPIKEETVSASLQDISMQVIAHEWYNGKYVSYERNGFVKGAQWQQQQVINLLKENGYADEPVFDLIEQSFLKNKTI